MASGVIFSESFGWASVAGDLHAAATGKWSAIGANAASGFGTSFGRVTGAKGLHFDLNRSNAQLIQKDFGASYTELTIGFALRITARNTTFPIVAWWEGVTEHQRLSINASGNFLATRAGTVLTGGTGATIYPINQWMYVWMRSVISNTVGTFKLIIDGATELNLTGQDTQNAGTGVINKLRFGHDTNAANPAAYDIADIVVINCAVNATDKLANDLRVEYLGPNADGNYNTAWPPSTGTSRFGVIDEIPPNSDTDYIEAAAVNDLVSVGLSDPSGSSGTIHTLVPWHVSKKTDAGAGSMQVGFREGSTDSLSSDQAQGTAYAHQMGVPQDAPPSGGSWDYTKVGATELLLKRTA